MDGQSTYKKRGCLVRLLFSRFVWVVVILAIAVFLCARVIDPTLEEHADSFALATEATDRQLSGENKYSGGNVELGTQIVEIAKQQGADIEVVREIFAAAANSGVSPHHLLGLAGKEASYCKNIGKGIAYVEASNRLNEEIKKGASQATIIWWNLQLESLKKIAEQLGMDVMEIPGSVGAGALSCFQLMPSNWLVYGGGDFRSAFQAAMNASKFLVTNGYDNSDETFKRILVEVYNPGGTAEERAAYVAKVFEYAAAWEAVSGDVFLYEGISVPWWVAFLENLAWYMEGGVGMPPWVAPGAPPGGPPPVIEGIANPYPGSSKCGNWYERRIGSYIHYGQDFCLPGTVSGPVYAAIDCRVTVAKLIPRTNWEAIYWSISGYGVVCEGQTEDGHKVEIIYGHLNSNTLPSVGDQLEAGGYLADTQCLGNPAVELCSITAGKPDHHLHFGVKIDGKWYNPNDFLKRALEALIRILRSL